MLEAWIDACLERPGVLPAGLEPVQTRLVRAVGRGRLPEIGLVYVKVMWFPRARDRLRYAHRALPAVHEARMLSRVRAVGIPCPAVVAAVARRRLGLPRLSMLVTRALDVTGEVTFAAAAAVAVRLAKAGVFHPDLKRDNFAALADGSVAVLDLQSARRSAGPLSASRKLRMAAKLVSEFDALGRERELVDAGLVPSALELDRYVRELRMADRRRRIARCLTTSTEFAVRRGWRGTLYRRREIDLSDERGWRTRPDARRLWIGDRAAEVLLGTAPMLGALRERPWWLPGPSSVYILGDDDDRSLSGAELSCLESGFARWRDLRR